MHDEKDALLESASSRQTSGKARRHTKLRWLLVGLALVHVAAFGAVVHKGTNRIRHTARWNQKDRMQSDFVFWLPCWSNLKYLCATIDVPTNHLDPSGDKTNIAVLKVPATCKKEDRLGSIFLNPGGTFSVCTPVIFLL